MQTDNVDVKDLFLRIAGDVGEMPNENIELGGTDGKNLSIDNRVIVPTMRVELSAEFAAFLHYSCLASCLHVRVERPTLRWIRINMQLI